MSKKTLWNHCQEFYQEQGIELPEKGSREATLAYQLWAAWAFSNVDGKTPNTEKAFREELDKWIETKKKERLHRDMQAIMDKNEFVELDFGEDDDRNVVP